ncbi:NADP-dependent phosphogluconate dehydrogenase [Vibrio fluvialis]|nr:NADP-dependent phosphogluconate dehydrogenase [Vibrio fluvialis]
MSFQIAMIGLGVMGKSLALNLVDHGIKVAGYDLNQANRMRTLQEAASLSTIAGKGQFAAADDLAHLLSLLDKPRVIALSVPAGDIVDHVITQLLDAGLEPQDIVIDTGNSLWTDSERREHVYTGRLRFFSTAVSGGEQGARHGPSLMASGDREAWAFIEPMWQAIAAKVDAAGKPIDSHQQGDSCAAYLGPAGAGHYVKMVHNGIEYADMQLICEAYQYLRDVMTLSAQEIGQAFERWNLGVLNSYLMEISADILQQQDPQTGAMLVDMILDTAEQKGTGLWTAVNSLQTGCPAPSLAQAVFARALSANKARRSLASKQLPAQTMIADYCLDTVLRDLESALYCAKLAVYAQGFDLLKTTSDKEGWKLNFADIARIWRSGCIIRAGFLHQIAMAYQSQPELEHLLLAPEFASALSERLPGWRQIAAQSMFSGVPMPSLTSALNYYDALRCEVLPANLLQAQRDYFGAHTYTRVDQPAGKKFHLLWETQHRQQVER